MLTAKLSLLNDLIVQEILLRPRRRLKLEVPQARPRYGLLQSQQEHHWEASSKNSRDGA